MRPSFFSPAAGNRALSRRLLVLVLAVSAVGAIGTGLIARFGQVDRQAQFAQPAAPAEPGLFEFPQARQSVPPGPEPLLAPKDVAVAPVVHTTPRPASATATNANALPSGVERFDTCAPACDSRDPARGSAKPAPQAAQTARVDVPRPPRGVGEGMPAEPEPGLIERTMTATRTAVSDVAEQMKGMIGMK